MLNAVMRRLLRALPWVLLDIQAVLALIYPDAFFYLPWLLRAAYLLVSYGVLKDLREYRGIIALVREHHTRIAHGLEHATIAVLVEHGVPIQHGYTHRPDRFMLGMDRGNEHHAPDVRIAAIAAIRRVVAGERSLLYQEGCSTSEAVFGLTLWLMILSSGLIALGLGAGMNVAFALVVILGHLWVALETQLGLVAQRLFTVSGDFTKAQVIAIRWRETQRETYFEIFLDIDAPREGGLVIPNIG